jgi:hypothetical protein
MISTTSDAISKFCRNECKVLAMRPTRITGLRQWVGVGLFSHAFFLVAFGVTKIFAAHGSRWDISWSAVLLGAARVALFVTLLTVLALGEKR